MSARRADPPHGTSFRYDHGTTTEPPCRQACCRQAKARARYRQERRRAVAGPAWVDVAPTREHVQALRAGGMAVKQIAAASGISEPTVHRLCRTTRQIKASTAAKLLAVRPGMPAGPVVLNCHISALGSQRRVHALMAVGWTLALIAEEAGTNRHVVENIHRGDRVTIRAHTAARIAEVTGRLWDQSPPQRTRVERRNVTFTLGLAARSGFVPLAAWDDIDDPTETPQGVRARRKTARAA